MALGETHGNRRYHPGDCADAVRKARHARNQAAYRARHNPPVESLVPADFRAGRVTVKGQVVPGDRAAAIRAAALKPLLASHAFHEALKDVHWSDVLNSQELGRLRSYVDDVLSLIEVIDEVIRVPDLSTDMFRPGENMEDGIVKRLERKQKRAGAPARRGSSQ
ncbi:hypothetical protein [Nocardioides sp. zg-1230]|uniref:hypothetical protein n=1 Tax=Nocardioides sp. zg-1230 TaxID=2736601 RepID=UPI001555336D|nr:hypothetical protein [Nocardioides sp. zg-1230]NPC41134.1 hypothetical protein [Nocardioides sp. zg-1230]